MDIDSNTVISRFGVVKVTPRLAILAEALCKESPRYVPKERIIQALHGAAPTEWADSDLNVGIRQLRVALGPLGLSIENSYGHGYRLVEATNPSTK